ncbi:hypothetical protein GUJ93_ZPchr0007g4761 [Zizania palustris]|uniref:Uncharacterized protein n=1 Tax=Zizania palustris TaxID=103762 RepID=A0A8J5TJR0_ZIZPA|nr:hypothetical protein GUJ93_ZPchr0007g4761 [Zizania palustris]
MVTSTTTTKVSKPLAKVLTELVHSVTGIEAYLAARDSQFSFGPTRVRAAVPGPPFTPGLTTLPPSLPTVGLSMGGT